VAARDCTVAVVTGPPCSGKSTLAGSLRDVLGWPVLAKDDLKHALFDVLGVKDRRWSQELGRAAIEVLVRISAELAATRTAHILDVNFIACRDADRIEQILAVSPSVVHLRCSAPIPVLQRRFEERVGAGGRHPGHVEDTQLEVLGDRLLAGEWDVDLPCPTLELDTHRLSAAAARQAALDALRRVRSQT